MEIWIVLSAMCSPLGFSDVQILGCFTDENQAKLFKKDQTPNLIDNYRVSIKKSWVNK